MFSKKKKKCSQNIKICYPFWVIFFKYIKMCGIYVKYQLNITHLLNKLKLDIYISTKHEC